MASKPNKADVGYVAYGPATGIPTPEPKNEVLGDSRYTGAFKPGTSKAVSLGHVEGGPGNAVCKGE